VDPLRSGSAAGMTPPTANLIAADSLSVVVREPRGATVPDPVRSGSHSLLPQERRQPQLPDFQLPLPCPNVACPEKRAVLACWMPKQLLQGLLPWRSQATALHCW